jgi:hypothetical protein
MTHLIRSTNLTEHDELYERLTQLHANLSEAERRRIDARLILLLMNHIGDSQVIVEAIEAAQQGRRPSGAA